MMELRYKARNSKYARLREDKKGERLEWERLFKSEGKARLPDVDTATEIELGEAVKAEADKAFEKLQKKLNAPSVRDILDIAGKRRTGPHRCAGCGAYNPIHEVPGQVDKEGNQLYLCPKCETAGLFE